MLHLLHITLPKIDFNSFAHFCLKIIELELSELWKERGISPQ